MLYVLTTEVAKRGFYRWAQVRIARPVVTEFGMSDKLSTVSYAVQEYQFLETMVEG